MSKTENLVKQLEYYFSDLNLSKDSFFHGLIAADKQGYVDISYIQKCNKIKKLNVSKKDIQQAASSSEAIELDKAKQKIRRLNNKQLPELKQQSKREAKGAVKKNQEESKQSADQQFDGRFQQEDIVAPYIVSIKVQKAGQETKANWRDIQDYIKENHKKLLLLYSRFQQNQGHIAFSSRKSNKQALKELVDKKLTLKDTGLVLKQLDQKQQKPFWEDHGAHFQFCSQKKLDYFKRQKKKEAKNKKIQPTVSKREKVNYVIAGSNYEGIDKVRSKAKTITLLKNNGQPLKGKEKDFILELLKFHQKYQQKIANMKDIIVDNHPKYENTRCFFVVKNDQSKEDFSLAKCIENLAKKGQNSKQDEQS